MSKKKLIIIIVIVALALGGLVFFLISNKKTPVEQAFVKQEIVEKTVTSSGEVKSTNQADLAFASSGTISNISTSKGSKVIKGASIAVLNSYAQSQSAKAYKDARDIAIRNRDLFVEQNKEAEQDNEYDLQIRKLDEQVSQAEATYRASLGSITNNVIRAPFAGTIIDILKEIGETAAPGETIVKMADLNNLYFEIELDQEDIGMVKLGQAVKINLDSYPDTTFDGEVSELPGYAETDSTGNQTFIVKIKINPSGQPVLLGMTGDAKIVVEKTDQPVNALDFDVIQEDEDTKYVWIEQDAMLAKKNIETGLEGDLTTEVKTDLSNTTIVVNPNPDKPFEEGAKVKVTSDSQ